MIGYLQELDRELTETGELLDQNGLSGPRGARTLRARPNGSPSISDGLRTGATDFLAGYWVIDVAKPERAIEIALRISRTPGPGGEPVNQQVEIHELGEPPEA
jgi:hypothetical protein